MAGPLSVLLDVTLWAAVIRGDKVIPVEAQINMVIRKKLSRSLDTAISSECALILLCSKQGVNLQGFATQQQRRRPGVTGSNFFSRHRWRLISEPRRLGCREGCDTSHSQATKSNSRAVSEAEGTTPRAVRHDGSHVGVLGASG